MTSSATNPDDPPLRFELRSQDYKSSVLTYLTIEEYIRAFNNLTGTLTDATHFNLLYITIVAYVCTPSIQGNTHYPDGILLS